MLITKHSKVRNAICFFFTVLFFVGCEKGQDLPNKKMAHDESGRPILGFAVAEPGAVDRDYEGVDLSTVSTIELQQYVNSFRSQGKFKDALQFQYWAVRNGDGQEGLYNLACAYSLVGEIDAAFYWLDQAAKLEGVSSDWVRQDSDLVPVRRTRRWPEMVAYIDAYNEYWKNSDVEQNKLIVPSNYSGKDPIPVLIGLHGVSADANGLVSDGFQGFADEMGIAILGVSGTNPAGPRSFSWSEEGELDYQRIRRSLETVKTQLTPDSRRIVLFGFSQGGKVAVEVAVMHPDEFAGALSLSGGGLKPYRLNNLAMNEEHESQGYVIRSGAGEHPDTVKIARRFGQTIERMGARLDLYLYPNVVEHSFPPDFSEKLADWFQFIVKNR